MTCPKYSSLLVVARLLIYVSLPAPPIAPARTAKNLPARGRFSSRCLHESLRRLVRKLQFYEVFANPPRLGRRPLRPSLRPGQLKTVPQGEGFLHAVRPVGLEPTTTKVRMPGRHSQGLARYFERAKNIDKAYCRCKREASRYDLNSIFCPPKLLSTLVQVFPKCQVLVRSPRLGRRPLRPSLRPGQLKTVPQGEGFLHAVRPVGLEPTTTKV